MELIANLQLSFARPSLQPKAPRNLLELAALLRRGEPGAEVADYSLLWAEELRRIQQSDHQSLSKKRGSLRRMWAEQTLIYQDLVASLEATAGHIQKREYSRVAQASQEFDDLLEEFADSLKEMDNWSRAETPRCLSCSWDGTASSCPHCGIKLLTPVRQTRPAAAPLSLAPHHLVVFRAVESVLRGAQDINQLLEPLEALQQDFCEAVVDANASAEFNPEMEVVAQILEVALEGLTEMGQTFEDYDAQHLEDGWHKFFVSQITLIDAVSEAESDHISFSKD